MRRWRNVRLPPRHYRKWAYQQQVLQQNQQAINAANRPRMTNCQYVGTYLNCTTF